MLVAHIVYRFDYGGLENGVVNIVNKTSGVRIKHVVIALTQATDFAERLREDVVVYSVGKKPGKDIGAYVRLYKLLRKLKPDIVHTRNIGTMDCAFVAFLARVPVRIHGEHGWDIHDPEGKSQKHRLLRRVLHPFVHHFVAVSNDLRLWLIEVVGIPESKLRHICNGVDTNLFHPDNFVDSSVGDEVVIGSVTRFAAIKDPLNLVEAFIELKRGDFAGRLVMLGDGDLREQAVARLQEAGIEDDTWLPGSCDDIPRRLRDMDIFVLGSLREGISNTILEAMASGLPIIATDTGGNGELIDDGVNGLLVPPGNCKALAEAIAGYIEDPEERRRHGLASRDRVVSRFSLHEMVENYRLLYEGAIGAGAN